jgi:hypothetical protein
MLLLFTNIIHCSLDAQMLEKHQQYRDKIGKPKFTIDNSLMQAAQVQSKYQSDTDRMGMWNLNFGNLILTTIQRTCKLAEAG